MNIFDFFFYHETKVRFEDQNPMFDDFSKNGKEFGDNFSFGIPTRNLVPLEQGFEIL